MITISSANHTTVTVYNANVFTVKVNVFVLNDSNVFENLNTQKIIAPDATAEWELADGEYYFEERNNANDALVANYNWLVFKAIADCFINKLKAWLCRGDDCGCSGDTNNLQLMYSTTSLIMLLWGYISMLNELMTLNYIFSTMSSTVLADMITIKGMRAKISTYCTNC